MPKYRSDFETLAVEYARYRSSYSNALFDAIATYAGPARRRAIDLACGTGLSTGGLVARGFGVTGVDMAPSMLEVARSSVPGATFFAARAESLPFADGAFGLVACGQAFHWFDARAALAEIERALAPGGAVALFWKDALLDDPFTKAADDLERAWSDSDPAVMATELSGNMRDAWPAAPFFAREKRVFDVSLRYSVASFVGYHGSRETLRLALGSRRGAYLDALRAEIAAMASHSGQFDVAAREYLYLGRRIGRT